MNNFYVTLPSNTKSFKKNTTAEFRVSLAKTIDLVGDWECGLASIQYPYTWNTLVKEKLTCYFTGITDPINLKIPDGNYSTITELLAILNYSYSEAIRKEENIGVMSNYITWNSEQAFGALRIDYSNTLKRVEIHIDSKIIKSMSICLHLQYVLGFKNNRFVLPYTLADYPPDITGGFTDLYIYTDLIEPQIVGDSETQLLRIVPLRGEFGDVVVNDYTNIHYLNVLNKRFDSVEVSIKDHTSTPIHFQYGKTILKLHFRRKRRFLTG